MSDPRPLHLHTVDSLCTDLICGQSISVGKHGTVYKLENSASRSILNWYRQNRDKWTKNVTATDIDAVVNAAQVEPPTLSTVAAPQLDQKKILSLAKIEAHRFGGLSAYSDNGQAPKSFTLELTKPITLLEGWNGSGKTSIVNAVIWCLTGQLLRPQRKPENANSEFECRIEQDRTTQASVHKLTPVTPLPNHDQLPDLSRDWIPIDTWVELTFTDDNGTTIKPIRRTQTRTTRGAINESLTGLDEIGFDPIAAQVGTTIPGLLPFIQIGSVSEFGQAIAELTGLSDLVDLARHATRVANRIDSEFRKAQEQEIESQNDAFAIARNDLKHLIDETASLAPIAPLPNSTTDSDVGKTISTLNDHFVALKTKVFSNAKTVLGGDFDPTQKEARENLETSVTPALSQLSEISKLPSMARIGALGKLTNEELAIAANALATISDEADTLDELAKNPSLARRKQLYARVSAWMTEHDYPTSSPCAVCGADTTSSVDSATGQLVRDELKRASEENAELLSHTVQGWAQSRLGQLSKILPEALINELRRDLPDAPIDLIKTALDKELFDTNPFKGTLAILRTDSRELANSMLGALPYFSLSAERVLPDSLREPASDLGTALRRIAKSLEFAKWQHQNREEAAAAVLKIITKKNTSSEPLRNESPLGVKLVALSDVIIGTSPINAALGYCERMMKALEIQQDVHNRIKAYDVAIAALKQIVALGSLAQQQVEDLRGVLQGRAEHWRSRFYNNAYETSGLTFVSTDMDSRGALSIFVGSKGISAPAQHVSNASGLRANLVGFFFSFWEHIFSMRGGFKLLVLDDPQELLDDDNRDRLARTLPELVKAGAQLLVTTHSREFARMSVEEARKTKIIEHRSVHPVNISRLTADTAGAIEELDRKRTEFINHVDDAIKAQEYVVEVRSFIEARLADLFDNPSYPAYSAPSKPPGFSDLIGRLRGLAGNPPNELFRKKAISDFCADRSLTDGSRCLALLNKAHHKDKFRITYKDVKDEDEHFRRLRRLIEDIHEEFRRWKWREETPSEPKIAHLSPMTKQTFKVQLHPDLAAFTASVSAASSQDADAEEFDGAWFEGKSLFYLRNDNLGFAAPAGSLAIVEAESRSANDRNLVIVGHEGRTLARRLLRPQQSAAMVALAAQTPDPRKSPPTVLADAAEMRVHRIVGILFDDVPPPASKQEAVGIEDAPCLTRIEAAYRVRDDSALPLALPGQIVLGGTLVRSAELDANIGKLVALTLMDGASIFKRVGAKLPGTMGVLRQFEAIGGLGSSQIIATEEIEEPFEAMPLMAFARIVLGVVYE